MRRWCPVMVVAAMACLLLSVPTFAQEKTAWDYIAVFAQGERGPEMEAQFAAIHGLVELGDAAVGPLLSVVKHQNKNVRSNVITALGRIGAEEGVESITAALADPEADVRGAAAEALGRIGDASSVQPLLALLAKEDEMDQRGAIVGLGWIKAQAAAEPIIAKLSSENWEVRWRAAVALGQIGSTLAAAPLTALAEDENPVVAAAVAWALGAIAGEPNFAPFTSNLSSEDAGTVWGSAWALGVIGSPAAVQVLSQAAAGDAETAKQAGQVVLLWLGVAVPEAPAAAAPAAEQ